MSTTSRLKDVMRSPARLYLIAGVFLALLALIENLTGAHDITSDGASGATLRFSIPLLMAGLGGLWSERAGVINIGLEGMMIVGTWLGAWFGFKSGPWVGMLAAAIGGILAGLLHALLTVRIGIDQAVSGLAINLLAYGLTRFLSGVYFPPAGGDILTSPYVHPIAQFTVPWLSPTLLNIEGHHWFFISNLAGIIAGLITKTSWASLLLMMALPLTAWILWKTKFGLRVRFSGENPVASESLGVNVYRTRFIAIAVSGMLAALGGAYISVVSTGHYLENQTAGRGYIGLATVIFGNWRPMGVLAGSVLFGWTDALRIRQSDSVHATLLAIVAIAALIFFIKLWQKKIKSALIALASGGLVLLYFFIQKEVPGELVTVFPNLTTLIVLAFLSQRLRPPAMAGAPYRKGEE